MNVFCMVLVSPQKDYYILRLDFYKKQTSQLVFCYPLEY